MFYYNSRYYNYKVCRWGSVDDVNYKLIKLLLNTFEITKVWLDIRGIIMIMKLIFFSISRYYLLELCRFISHDNVSYLKQQSVNGLNL